MRIASILFSLLISTAAFAQQERQSASIDPPLNASEPEQVAATELARYLRIIYPGMEFALNASQAGKRILLGTPQSAPELLDYVSKEKLHVAESYVVTSATIDGKETGIILGADPQGLIYGVYALLEKLGYGFFISFDALPRADAAAFNFKKWNLENHPTTPARIVFNWHNFLSGCSGWDLEQWTHWIDQSQKGGYNTIMVHAYGNNPMFPFSFNGQDKPVGYLTSSIKGRDWSVNHVNDVRRLAGGAVFDKAVFGSAAALVADEKRVQAAVELMQDTFEHARKRGVKVNFSVDFDTPSSNPQSLVRTLSPADRFTIDNTWVARPDTAAGYEFYKAQARSMVENYPQVTTVTLWRRSGADFGSKWPGLKKDEMPESWQKEYDALIRQDPAAADLHQSVPAFGMAKVVAAWRRALDELDRQDIELAIGSWRFDWVDSSAKFLPEPVKIIALDYRVTHGEGEFRNQKVMERLKRSVEPGRFIPVIWAHHDDGQYLGAPLRTYHNLASELSNWNAGGFGIIHWMTHPLDLFFASHGRQTWTATIDEDLADTAQWMATRYFGQANSEVMGHYLDSWASSMPFFGRETGNAFIDRPMHRFKDLEMAIKGCEDRLALLAQADPSKMTETERNRYQYFVEFEKFVSDFFKTETTFERAKEAFEKNNRDLARTLMRQIDPEGLLERYAEMSKRVGISRGEEGLIVSMNLRWIPHYVSFRQQLGIDAVRYNYGETSHEALAMVRGVLTFHASPDGKIWQTFGEEETGNEVFSVAIEDGGQIAEIAAQGIQSSDPIEIIFAPGNRHSLPLPAGEYQLSLIFAEPDVENAGERVMRIELGVPVQKNRYAFPALKTQFMRLLCRGNQQNKWNSIHHISGVPIRKDVPLQASAEAPGYPAQAAADNDQSSRWAAHGKHWLRFAVDPEVEMNHIEVSWYGQGRNYQFDIQVSSDGENWQSVEHTEVKPEFASLADESVDIFKQAGGRNKPLVLEYTLTLDTPGNPSVRLVPVKGNALVSGAILEKIN